MHVIKTKLELSTFVDDVKKSSKTLGFVPTMGALHQGHLSLIQQSKVSTQITIASIFVNPTQFNNADDLKNYPRNLQKDLDLLEHMQCDAVFVPSVDEMYPEIDTRIFEFDGIDKLMEGEHRPGHFNGVAQIVSKLFEAVKPHKAFFGQKDFQQVAIIKKMVNKLNFQIEIIACPIVREHDGLAMSSRNLLLEPEYRNAAPNIYRILTESQIKAKKLETVEELKNWVINQFNEIPLLKLEYFEIVNQNNLLPVEQIQGSTGLIGCIALWAGKVRLIDNIIYNY
jgi:pantoate--beta-alanine ligase